MTTAANHNGAGNRTCRVGSAGKTSSIPHYRIEEEQQFKECYETGRKLGEGSFGIVYELIHRETRDRWACKVVNKDNSKEKGWGSKIKLLEREVDILKRVNHEHIINLKEVFETPQKMYLVMGLCEGGELSKELKRRGHLTERETRKIMERLTSAISYLHKKDMVHRDLKLENILLSNNPNDAEDKLYIKVTDFGLSVVKGGVGHENMMMDFCGTPMYMAPEIIDNKTYSEKCDVWAMGVIMCALLTGVPPFSGYGSDDELLYAQIKNLDMCQYVNSDASWKDISEECKDCMSRMMTLDPAHRLTASELLDQPWITGETLDPEPGPRNVLEMMKAWQNDLDEDNMTSEKDGSMSAMTNNSNNRPSSASSKPPSASRMSQGGESSQDEASAPTSRNGSANSGKSGKLSADSRRASLPTTALLARASRRSIPRIATLPSLQNETAASQKTASSTSVKSRTNSLPRNSLGSNSRTPSRKSPSDSGPGSSSNNNSRSSVNRNTAAAAATSRAAARQSTKPTVTSTGRSNKISQDANKSRKVTR